MQVTVIPKRIPATLRDRFAAAWEAFNVKTKRNPEFWVWREKARQDRIEAALSGLSEMSQEAIRKSSSTAPIYVIAAIEEATNLDDQVELVRYVVRKDPHLVCDDRFRDWQSRNVKAMVKFFEQEAMRDGRI